MSERQISVSVDSFPRSNTNGYADLGNLLASDVAQESVAGLHYPAHVLENIYLIDELNKYISGSDALIEDATVIADLSISGGYAAADLQFEALLKRCINRE
jgi:hypothetical protein